LELSTSSWDSLEVACFEWIYHINWSSAAVIVVGQRDSLQGWSFVAGGFGAQSLWKMKEIKDSMSILGTHW
jgi:hypothetical protein